MARGQRVVLYGDSLVLAGVGESLRRYPRLEVVVADASRGLIESDLHTLRPGAVIIDLGLVSRELAFDLLHDHPDLLLIGLDPGGDRLIVLSGQQARALTTDDLVRLIDRGNDQPGREANEE